MAGANSPFPVDDVAGFAPGMEVAVYDAGGSIDFVTITAVDAGNDRLSHDGASKAYTVLNGTATLNCVVELHAFSDEPELVSAVLAGSGWEARSVERRSRRTRSQTIRVPAFRFAIDAQDLVVEVHPRDGIRQAPLSPIDQRPMRRAGRKIVEELLEQA